MEKYQLELLKELTEPYRDDSGTLSRRWKPLSSFVHKTEDLRVDKEMYSGIEVKCPYCKWRTLIIPAKGKKYSCNICRIEQQIEETWIIFNER